VEPRKRTRKRKKSISNDSSGKHRRPRLALVDEKERKRRNRHEVEKGKGKKGKGTFGYKKEGGCNENMVDVILIPSAALKEAGGSTYTSGRGGKKCLKPKGERIEEISFLSHGRDEPDLDLKKHMKNSSEGTCSLSGR